MTGKRAAAGRLAAIALTAILMLGCGYGLVGRTSTLPEDIEDVFVQPLANRTTRTQVDQVLTRAISSEFVKRRRFTVVSDRSSADAVLTGVVTSFIERPVTFGEEGRGTEYEIQITADMEFKRPGAQEPIWERRGYGFRDTYPIDISAADYFDRANLAIADVAQQFAETLVIDLLEGF